MTLKQAQRTKPRVCPTHQSTKNEDHNERSADGRDAVNVAIAHGGHSDHDEVDALPVGQVLSIFKVVEGIPRDLHLQQKKNNDGFGLIKGRNESN